DQPGAVAEGLLAEGVDQQEAERREGHHQEARDEEELARARTERSGHLTVRVEPRSAVRRGLPEVVQAGERVDAGRARVAEPARVQVTGRRDAAGGHDELGLVGLRRVGQVLLEAPEAAREEDGDDRRAQPPGPRHALASTSAAALSACTAAGTPA